MQYGILDREIAGEKEKAMIQVIRSKKVLPRHSRTLDDDLLVVLKKSVEELDHKVLGIRAYNCIQAVGIETLGELATKTTEDVLGWKKAGKVTVKRINEALEPFDLSLDTAFAVMSCGNQSRIVDDLTKFL